MAATTRPQDKYALLFSGPTLDPFRTDLVSVFQTLTTSWHYPAGNITIVLGSAPAVLPSFPGATVTTIATAAQFESALTTFAAAASGPVPGGWKTALLYCTGGGLSQAGVARLVLDGGDGSNNVDPAWLTTRLNAFHLCHVHVVMQQSYSGGFLTALTGSALPQWSFTHACSATQQSFGNNTEGGFFTHGWCRGLRLETLPAGAPDAGKYADQLGTVGESTHLKIALGEAKAFGQQVHDLMGFGALSTPGYQENGGPQYLGEPAFLIRDAAPPAWWESPDISLAHPNHPWVPAGDLYIPDLPTATPPYNNTIQVVVRNVGTHPVRAYSLGIEVFKSGAGATNAQYTICDKVPTGGVLLPMDVASVGTPEDHTDLCVWNTPFYQGVTHGCVLAEAKLLCSEVDFSWSVVARDAEAQRNTDEMTLVPPPTPAPLPLKNLQGVMEHLYSLHNRFDTPRRFLLVFPETYHQHREILDLQWFAMPAGPQAEVVPLEVVAAPVPHLPFLLKSGETRDLLLRATMKPQFTQDREVRLPVDILVGGEWPPQVRAAAATTHWSTYAPIGGFTVVVRRGSATLTGIVLDAEKRPAAEARVWVQTANHRQGATVTTGRDGRFTLEAINPDVYRLRAEAGTWRAKEQYVVLLPGKEVTVEIPLAEDSPGGAQRVKVILDKIRIMNDHDPCLRGPGELTFTAVVVPDNDTSRTQVTRLPAQGVYTISDRPGENDLPLDVTLFEGVVHHNTLELVISGKEIDHFDPDDELHRYHRRFTGDSSQWYGQYAPTDEYLDREDVGDWALWYRIVRG